MIIRSIQKNQIIIVSYCCFFLLLFSFLFLFLTGCSNEKKIYKQVPFNRVEFIKNDTIIKFYTKPTEDKAPSNISEDKWYTWYRPDSIYVTKGSYSGKLLHGEYVEVYPDKALKQKGKYKDGLKDGKWYSWFQNGERQSLITWSKGIKNGKFESYSLEGKLQHAGNYTSGKADGEFSDMLPDGKTHTIIYNKGEIIKDTIINKL